MAGDITTVSAERIGVEIRRMLLDANRAVALRLLRECSLLVQVLPEVAKLSVEEQDEIERILESLEDPSLPLTIAVLLRVEPPGEFPACSKESELSLTPRLSLPGACHRSPPALHESGDRPHRMAARQSPADR